MQAYGQLVQLSAGGEKSVIAAQNKQEISEFSAE
jgi:hypothetical protein